MRKLFGTRLRIVIVLAVLLTAALAVLAGVNAQPPAGDTTDYSGLSVPERVMQTVMTPIKTLFTSITSQAEQYYSYLFRYEALAAENAQLKATIAQMEDVARKADAITRENERLRTALELQAAHEDYVMVDAYIIGWSITDYTSTFTINRGTDAGIFANQVAVTANGEVVGLVTQVGKNFAVVKTVLDSTLEISATIASSGYNGMVSGGYVDGAETLLRMDYLPTSSIIRNKDQVVTSGSTVYPRGLILGNVVDAGFEETGVAKFALLDPAAEINSLEQVFIITQFTTELPQSTAPAAPTEPSEEAPANG